MMRRTIIPLLIAACLMMVGFALLRLDGEHLYTGHDGLYQFAAGLGLLMLFAALIIMLVAYGRLSLKLAAWKALVLGLATMGTSSAVMRVIRESVNVDSWTFSLLALPMTLLLSGGVAAVIGLFRLLKKYVAVQ
jgi:hypothetical protein